MSTASARYGGRAGVGNPVSDYILDDMYELTAIVRQRSGS